MSFGESNLFKVVDGAKQEARAGLDKDLRAQNVLSQYESRMQELDPNNFDDAHQEEARSLADELREAKTAYDGGKAGVGAMNARLGADKISQFFDKVGRSKKPAEEPAATEPVADNSGKSIGRQERLGRENAEKMKEFFGENEYGVKHYDKDGNEVDKDKTLSEKNSEEMLKYFGKDEYGVKHYDKDGNEVDKDKTLSEKNSEEMLKYFGKDEYGVKHYDKDGNEIIDKPETLEEKNKREMLKYFDKDEYGVKHYDKNGSEIIDPGEIPISGEAKKAETVRYEDKEIRELSEKLDAARRAYIIKSNVVNEKSSFFKKILGFGKKGAHLGEFNAELEEAKLNYESALKNYKDALVGSMVSDRGDVEIMAQFLNKGEHLNIAKTRDQVRFETGGWPEKLKGGYVKMLENYKKLPMWKKVTLGVGLAGVGLASGAWAGAATAGALMTARRLFSMSVGSLGYSQMFEGMAEKGRANRSEAEARDIAAESQSELGEIDAEKLSQMLDLKIKGIDREIQDRDLAKKWRTYGAIGAGVATSFLGSSIFQHFAESDMGKTAMEYWQPKLDHLLGSDAGLGETLAEKAGIGVSDQTINPGNAGAPDGIPGQEAPNNPVPEAAEKAAATSAFEKTVDYQGGKSVWDEAHKQLEVRFKEAFDGLGGGDSEAAEALKVHNIDRIKDLIVADPEKFGLPKEVDFNRMSAEQLQNIKWDAAFEEVFGNGGLTEDLSGNAEVPSAGNPPIEAMPAGNEFDSKVNEFAQRYHESVGNINSPEYAKIYNDNVKALLGGENALFGRIIDVDAQKYLSENAQGDAVKFLESLRKSLEGDTASLKELDPKTDESMFEWSARVANIMRSTWSK
ncbi:MAG: hypothetical protein Q8L10_04710 [Candidatus Moranbacteria bacterium]|nr:hypothetical protein [Candidatus Moranbacteria bacterium]